MSIDFDPVTAGCSLWIRFPLFQDPQHGLSYLGVNKHIRLNRILVQTNVLVFGMDMDRVGSGSATLHSFKYV